MSKKLKSLEEYNREKRHREQSPYYNGIACPNCGAELVDSNPGLVLTSNPLQKHVHCLKNDYKGIILA